MLRRHFFLLAVLLTSISGLAWATDKTPVTSNAKLFNPLESESRIMSDIYYLTSDELEGRGSTTEGINKAAEYIAGQLKKAGLQPAGVDGTYFQPYDFKLAGPRLGNDNYVKFTVAGNTIEFPKTTVQTLGAGNAGVLKDAAVVFTGFGITNNEPGYDDYEGVDVAGKVVIILRKSPQQDEKTEKKFAEDLSTLTSKINRAIEKKAGAIILVNDATLSKDSDDLVRFNFAGTRAKKEAPPVFHVKRSVIDQMLGKAGMKSLKDIEATIVESQKPCSAVLKDVTVSLKADINRDGIKIKNVMATVPGAGDLAEEIVYVGSHYDHVGRGETGSLANSKEIHHGADDNASGSCCNLEIARRWQDLQSGPNATKNRRRVVFQWYSAEEWGLIGSDFYTKNPLFPWAKTASMLNLDMVGRLGFDENKLGKNLDEEGIKRAREKKYPLEIVGVSSAKEFEALVDKANADLNVEIIKPLSSPYFGASDHYSFYKRQIPVLFFFTGMHPQYHRPTDVWQTVNIKGIRQCAELGQNILEGLTTMAKPEFQKPGTNIQPSAESARKTFNEADKKINTPPVKAEKSPTPAKGDKKEEKTDPHAGKASTDGDKEIAPVKVPRMGIMFDYNDPGPGVMIDSVTDGKPAQKAGLKSGDRILEINGRKISSMNDGENSYMLIMSKYKPGQELTLLVDRKSAPGKLKIKVVGE